MPNWCTNWLRVTGPVRDLLAFDEQFKREHVSYYGSERRGFPDAGDLNDPQVLEMRVNWSGTKGKPVITLLTGIERKRGYSFKNFVPMSKDDFLNGWYDWALEHWGTKWDLLSSEVGVYGLEEAQEYMNQGMPDEVSTIEYFFQTAWSPCEPVVQEMSRQYPTLSFVHEFDEEGCLIAGIVTWKAGIEEERREANDDNYMEFLRDELGYDNIVECPACHKLNYAEDIECYACETELEA